VSTVARDFAQTLNGSFSGVEFEGSKDCLRCGDIAGTVMNLGFGQIAAAGKPAANDSTREAAVVTTSQGTYSR